MKRFFLLLQAGFLVGPLVLALIPGGAGVIGVIYASIITLQSIFAPLGVSLALYSRGNTLALCLLAGLSLFAFLTGLFMASRSASHVFHVPDALLILFLTIPVILHVAAWVVPPTDKPLPPSMLVAVCLLVCLSSAGLHSLSRYWIHVRRDRMSRSGGQ